MHQLMKIICRAGTTWFYRFACAIVVQAHFFNDKTLLCKVFRSVFVHFLTQCCHVSVSTTSVGLGGLGSNFQACFFQSSGGVNFMLLLHSKKSILGYWIRKNCLWTSSLIFSSKKISLLKFSFFQGVDEVVRWSFRYFLILGHVQTLLPWGGNIKLE